MVADIYPPCWEGAARFVDTILKHDKARLLEAGRCKEIQMLLSPVPITSQVLLAMRLQCFFQLALNQHTMLVRHGPINKQVLEHYRLHMSNATLFLYSSVFQFFKGRTM